MGVIQLSSRSKGRFARFPKTQAVALRGTKNASMELGRWFQIRNLDKVRQASEA
jgi:hypothetical protein